MDSSSASAMAAKADDGKDVGGVVSLAMPVDAPGPSPTARPFSPRWWYGLVDPRISETDPSALVTSVHVSPEALLIYRVVCALWVIAAIIPERGAGIYFVCFFTNLCWTGLLAFFLNAILHSIIYIRSGYDATFIARQPTIVRWISLNLYMLPAVFGWIVPVVFWSLLAGPLFEPGTTALSWWFNLSVHFLDFVFILGELILARTPVFATQWTGFLAVSLLYLCLTQVVHAQLGFWVYGFLDTSLPLAPVFYIGLIVLFLLAFFGVAAIHAGRDRRRARLGLSAVAVWRA